MTKVVLLLFAVRVAFSCLPTHNAATKLKENIGMSSYYLIHETSLNTSDKQAVT